VPSAQQPQAGLPLPGAERHPAGEPDHSPPAKGGETYNQQLSDKPAEAVKALLVWHHGITPDTRLIAGCGKTGPKKPADPFAGENRRVDVVNLAQPEEARPRGND
jgi:flagellar motor protein MotB